MHPNGFGITNRLTRQALDPGAQRQVFAFNLPGVPLARLVLISVQMTRVHTPIIRIIACDSRGFQMAYFPAKVQI